MAENASTAPWLCNFVFINTRGKRIFYSEHLHITPMTDSDGLSLDAASTHSPVTVSSRRNCHDWSGGVSHHPCDLEVPESVTGRGRMEEKYAKPSHHWVPSIHHGTTLPPYLSLMFHFWLWCTVSSHLKEKNWWYWWSAIWQSPKPFSCINLAA